jgi:hypothetical protein
MITGFNTDVTYGKTVYHVQTEDKGVQNPLIESLIYVKGAILDSHRTYYQSFLESQAFSESRLQKILEFQHRQIVAAIKKGQFRKGMNLRAYVDDNFVFNLEGPKAQNYSESNTLSSDTKVGNKKDSSSRTRPETEEFSQTRRVAIPKPSPLHEIGQGSPRHQPQLEPNPNRIEFAIDANEVAELSVEQGIEICVEGSKDFSGGSHVDLYLYVQSRQNRVRLENVQVIVKIIGTTFSPRLYAGKTDKNGCLRMNFNLPAYSVGSAALIIQASTGLGNDEIKYLIRRK